MARNEHQISRLLAEKFPAPEYAFLTQVRNATGFARTVRTADALAMSCYPSRGLHLHGFEVKSHRSDWLKELRDPDKAEEIAKHCHFWWVVTAGVGVAKLDEVPPNWGLMHVHETPKHGVHLKTVRKAVQADALAPSHGLLASILRNAIESRELTAEGLAKAAEEAGYKRGVVDGAERARRMDNSNANFAKRDHDRLKQSVADFEKASGIKIDAFNGHQMGDAVAWIEKHRAIMLGRRIKNIEADLARMHAAMKAAREDFEGIEREQLTLLGGKA